MEIPTVNRLQDKHDFNTYLQLNNTELVLDDVNYLTLKFQYGKMLKIHKDNLLRVLVPYGCYIKKWILTY